MKLKKRFILPDIRIPLRKEADVPHTDIRASHVSSAETCNKSVNEFTAGARCDLQKQMVEKVRSNSEKSNSSKSSSLERRSARKHKSRQGECPNRPTQHLHVSFQVGGGSPISQKKIASGRFSCWSLSFFIDVMSITVLVFTFNVTTQYTRASFTRLLQC